MAEPGWISQPVPATGAITSEGIRNQLGRPGFDRLTVLVRESAQNSSDAVLSEARDPVRYEVGYSSIVGSQAAAWQALAGGGEARGVPDVGLIEHGSPLSILCVSDRGTTGLGGTTRADVADDKDDYVAFVLNVGEPRDKDLGGGTFGFGKAVFFTTSSVGTVVVYTSHRLPSGEIESRLIGIALGHSYSADGRNFTGRHWWGLRTAEGVEPLLNDEADRVALSLGMPLFDAGDTGTTVAILRPELDGRTPHEAMRWIASAIGWHLWPKMLSRGEYGGLPEMTFRVACEEEEIPVPSPDTHVSLAAFAKAYRLQQSEEARMLRCGNPARDLGRLGLHLVFGAALQTDPVAQEAGIVDGVHHVALMRAANLVVRYEQGPAMAHEHVWYAGVFKPELELDDTFARAEPPTHDSWVFEQLTGDEKTFVRVAERRLREALAKYASPRAGELDDDSMPLPLGAASHRFAGLLARAGSLAPGVAGGKPPPTGNGRRYQLVNAPRFEPLDGVVVLVQDINVNPGEATTLEPSVEVALWGGGRETDPPLGVGQPCFRCWLTPDDVAISEPALALGASDSGIWRVVVTPAADTATSIAVKERAS